MGSYKVGMILRYRDWEIRSTGDGPWAIELDLKKPNSIRRIRHTMPQIVLKENLVNFKDFFFSIEMEPVSNYRTIVELYQGTKIRKTFSVSQDSITRLIVEMEECLSTVRIYTGVV